jgi:hypothetical protein
LRATAQWGDVGARNASSAGRGVKRSRATTQRNDARARVGSSSGRSDKRLRALAPLPVNQPVDARAPGRSNPRAPQCGGVIDLTMSSQEW